VRQPDRVFYYATELLGKTYGSAAIANSPHFAYPLVKSDRGLYAIYLDENTSFDPEEIVAMILRQAQGLAETAAGNAVLDCVITVSPATTQAEARALVNSAKIAGMNVLGLLTEGTAGTSAWSCFVMIMMQNRSHTHSLSL
jgi:hypoxia up-regulated 1